MKKSNKNYSKDLKISVVKKYKEGGLSLQEIANIFEVSSKTQIHSWVRKYESDGEDAFTYERRGNPKILRKIKENTTDLNFLSLEEELEFLRMENEYLKKLCGYMSEKKRP